MPRARTFSSKGGQSREPFRFRKINCTCNDPFLEVRYQKVLCLHPAFPRGTVRRPVISAAFKPELMSERVIRTFDDAGNCSRLEGLIRPFSL